MLEQWKSLVQPRPRDILFILLARIAGEADLDLNLIAQKYQHLVEYHCSTNFIFWTVYRILSQLFHSIWWNTQWCSFSWRFNLFLFLAKYPNDVVYCLHSWEVAGNLELPHSESITLLLYTCWTIFYFLQL